MTRQTVEQARAVIVEIATATHRKLYEATGNPIHVWAAYLQVRRLRLPRRKDDRRPTGKPPSPKGELPAWILEYFDASASRLLERGATQTPKATAEALGLLTRRGGASARERAANAKRDVGIRDHVALRRRKGMTEDEARHDIASLVNLSPDAVRKIVYQKPRK